MTAIRLYILAFALIFISSALQAQGVVKDFSVNHSYSPSWWQSSVNLPFSSRKVLVGQDGRLMYEYPAANSSRNTTDGFSTFVSVGAGVGESWKSQNLYNARVPMVVTLKEWKDLTIKEEAFTVAPLLFGAGDSTINDYLGTSLGQKVTGVPGNDLVIVTIENKGAAPVNFSPLIHISSFYPFNADTAKGKIYISDFLRVVLPYSIVKTTGSQTKSGGKTRNVLTLSLKPVTIAARGKLQLAFGVSHGLTAIDCPNNIQQALNLQRQTIAWWENSNLPYSSIQVPDKDIQNLVDASIRNIYQNAETSEGKLALMTGPSSGRQVQIADAPFMIDALLMLNQREDATGAMEHLLKLQKADGSFQQVDKDWKATGQVLWAIANYARITGDKVWLESNWPRLEKGLNFLMDLQKSTLQNPKAAYAGLLPPGSGSEGQGIDYVHNYWGLAGLNAAINAARWVGRNGQAIKWQPPYDDYYKAFLESASKNTRKDQYGNNYLPVRATLDKKQLPQRSQWAFLNAVYPGKIFDLNNTILTGNMKMLGRSVKEGVLAGTGWLNNGLVITTASDYAHALQWSGKAQEVPGVLYAMSNHAAPNFAWFEQQSVSGTDSLVTGDMPNGRVSAEFIRVVRHMIVMERAYDLHFLEGVPAAWTKPGMVIQLNKVLTEFGLLDFKLQFSKDGKTATLDMNLDTNNRRAPQKTVLHLDGIAGNPAVIELELKPNLHKVFNLD